MEVLSNWNIEIFQIDFITFRLFDLIDIGLIALVGFHFHNYIRGTVAAQIFSGLLVIVIAFAVASLLNFVTLKWIVSQIISVWIVIIIILFQPEIRRALIFLGRSPFVSKFLSGNIENNIKIIRDALKFLKQTHTGALIVFARGSGLKSYSETGIPLNANLSSELLISIFYKNSALHDGAVIIENGIIESARCVLPLSTNQEIAHSYGTRHRAAVGISEITDSVAIVVSEETSQISIAENGKLATNLSLEKISSLLLRHLAQRPFSIPKWKKK